MHNILRHIDQYLDTAASLQTLRSLQQPATGIDFCSNDYLGFARNSKLHEQLVQCIQTNPAILYGSTGSRLISGNSLLAEHTETFIATQHKSAAALLFPSGYMANLALWSALPQRGDTLILDEYIHRSVHDGCRLSPATRWKFRHNDCNDLESKLKKTSGNCFVGIESLYSMDGDLVPLQDIAELCTRYGAALLVDEAHAMGIFGLGLVHQLALQERVMATTITYGKAMGCHGAAVLCPESVKQYLINKASPLIYTTAAPDSQWLAIKAAYAFLSSDAIAQQQLQDNILHWKGYQLSAQNQVGPIQTINCPGVQEVKKMKQTLQKEGINCYAVCSPTVQAGTERLRICLHSYNLPHEIELLATTVSAFL